MITGLQFFGLIVLFILAVYAIGLSAWESVMHPYTGWSEGWRCFFGGHQRELHQAIDSLTHVFYCPQCHGAWEGKRYRGVWSTRPWTKDTQQFYTSMNYRIRPLPNAGVQSRKVHGGRAP